MSEQPDTGALPEFDLADRMRKALRHANVGVGTMADYLDVRRETVSTWINGRITPSTQTLRLWAMRCGVPYEWLQTGATSTPPTSGDALPAGSWFESKRGSQYLLAVA